MATIEELQAENTKLITESAALRKQVEEVTSERGSFKSDRDSFEARLIAADAQLTPLKTELSTAKDTVSQYEVKLKQFTDQAERVVSLEAELATHKTSYEALNGQVTDLKTRQLKTLADRLVNGYNIDPKALENKSLEQLEAIQEALPAPTVGSVPGINSSRGMGFNDNTGGASNGHMTQLDSAMNDLKKLGIS